MRNKYKNIIHLALLLCFSFISFSQESDSHYIIATGSRGGNYYKTGEYIAEQYNKAYPNLSFSVIETNGSNENIELIKKNSVDFAIVQRNILISNVFDEENGTKSIAVISPLFQEKLWIYHKGKKSFNIKKIDSLSKMKPQRVGFTSKKGYSYTFFKTITKFLNINYSNLIEVEANYADLLTSFEKGEIDYIVSFSLPLDKLKNNPEVSTLFLSNEDALMIEKRVHNVYATSIDNTNKKFSLGSWSFLVGTKKQIKSISPEGKLITSLTNNKLNNSNTEYYKYIKKSNKLFIENKYHEDIQLRNLPLFSELQKKNRIKCNQLETLYNAIIFYSVITYCQLSLYRKFSTQNKFFIFLVSL